MVGAGGVFPLRMEGRLCAGQRLENTPRGEHLMAGGPVSGSQCPHTMVLRETQETACSSVAHLQTGRLLVC